MWHLTWAYKKDSLLLQWSQVQVQVQVHLFTLGQLQYNNNKDKKKEEIKKNRANYTTN